MHRPVENVERSAEILDDALQPQADAEDRQAAPDQQLQRLGHGEIGRAAGAGREHDQVGCRTAAQGGAGQGRTQGFDGGAGFAEIAGQRVDEGILVVDQQDAPARAGRAFSVPRRLLLSPPGSQPSEPKP